MFITSGAAPGCHPRDLPEPLRHALIGRTARRRLHRLLVVLRDMMFGNRRHFRELLAGSEEGIASNILADRLKRLVGAGLLTRENTRPGQRATYSLTEPVIQLVPVLAELDAWGARHRATTPWLRVRAELLAKGGPEMWAQFMNELREIHLRQPSRRSAGPSVTERLAEAYASVPPE